jgi:hypothetical protein
MKKFYLLILVSFLAVTPLFAQEYVAARLTLKNGNVREGLVKNFAPNARAIKFRASEKSKKEKLKSADIRMAQLPTQDGGFITLENMRVKGYRRSLIVQKLDEGPVNLYHMRVFQGALGAMDHYMFKRPDEEKCTVVIALTIGSRKHLRQYFEDCQPLVEKIKSGDLTEIPEMVAFYNQQMSK